MKFKLKLSKKQPEKDFISQVKNSLDEVQYMLNEAKGIKEVLTRHERKAIEVRYAEGYSSQIIARIEMDDLMVDYLKDKLSKLEEKIKEKVA